MDCVSINFLIHTNIKKFLQLQEERAHTYKIFEEGHKIYLTTAPQYDFERFRTLVHDVTEDFKRISNEIITIEKYLRNELNETKFSEHIANIQKEEKKKLELAVQVQLTKQGLQDNPPDSESIEERHRSYKKNINIVHLRINDELQEIRELLQDLPDF